MTVTLRRRVGASALIALVLVAFAATSAAAAGNNVTAIGSYDYHSCALKSDGSVWCWGDNEYGQMGDGTQDNRYTPVRVESSEGVFLTGMKSIAPSGYDHTCGVKDNATVRCWGENGYGNLGALDSGQHLFPVTVKVKSSGNTLTKVRSVTAGQNHSCALKTNGTVWCWGGNDSGQLGDGGNSDQDGAVQVQKLEGGALTGAVAIGAGNRHTCAVMSNSTLRCWGSNTHGELAIGSSDVNAHPLATLAKTASNANFTGVTQVDGGYNFTCALKSNRNLYCWGDNDAGMVGNGDGGGADVLNPVLVMRAGGPLKDVRTFGMGASHACATTGSNKAFCWGNNVNGELGLGDPIDSVDLATRVRTDESTLFPATAKSIRGSDSGTCILKTDQTVWCMGYAEYGQIGYDPSPDPDPADYIFFPEKVDFP